MHISDYLQPSVIASSPKNNCGNIKNLGDIHYSSYVLIIISTFYAERNQLHSKLIESLEAKP